MKTMILLGALLFSVKILAEGAGTPSSGTDIKLDASSWRMDEGVAIENGVMSLKGSPDKYRKAQFPLSLDGLTESNLYITAKVKVVDLVPGSLSFQTAKLKAFMADKPDLRKASWISALGKGMDWATICLAVPMNWRKSGSKLVIELAMENCVGNVLFKDLRISSVQPPPDSAFPFNVPSSPCCRLDIDSSKGCAFNNELLGLNSHFMEEGAKKLSYGDSRVKNLLASIKPPLMRFPGGTVANWYNYQTDMWELTDVASSSDSMIERLSKGIAEGRKFGFDNYLELSKRNSFKTTLVLNILHDSPERCANNVLDRKRRGLLFPWVELGNECYDPSQQSKEVRSVEDYIAKARKAAVAIKAVSPETVVAVDGDGPQAWEGALAKENFYDAVVSHPYSMAGYGAGCFSFFSTVEGLCAYARLKSSLAHTGSLYGGRPLLLTEWGVLGDEPTANTHLASLGTADMFFGIMEGGEDAQVKTACLHIFSGGYMGLYDYDPKRDFVFKRGYAIVFDMILKAFKDSQLLSSRSSSQEISPGQHSMAARASIGKDGVIRIYAVNLLPLEAPLLLSMDGKSFAGKYSMKSFSETQLSAKGTWGLEVDPCLGKDGSGSPDLPPYSISLISIVR